MWLRAGLRERGERGGGRLRRVDVFVANLWGVKMVALLCVCCVSLASDVVFVLCKIKGYIPLAEHLHVPSMTTLAHHPTRRSKYVLCACGDVVLYLNVCWVEGTRKG